MQRVPFQKSFLDPRRVNNYLDSCAFDPKYAPEDSAAQEIRSLWKDEHIRLVLLHSIQKEVEHPNTPADVKREAGRMLYTMPTGLNVEEVARRQKIHAILTGNGKPENCAWDADHVFEAGKYGGYFITTDRRILTKREELRNVTAVVILTPSKWLKVFRQSGSQGR